MVLCCVFVPHAILWFDFTSHPVIEFIKECCTSHEFNTGCYTVFETRTNICSLPVKIYGIVSVFTSAIRMKTTEFTECFLGYHYYVYWLQYLYEKKGVSVTPFLINNLRVQGNLRSRHAPLWDTCPYDRDSYSRSNHHTNTL